MPAFEWVHVQLHQQKGMISLSPPTICNSAKQSHLAELMGVDQATVSRWERGTLALSDGRWSAVLQLLTGPSDSSYDAALKRLVQSSAHKVHLVATGHIVCSRHLRPGKGNCGLT
ncbi:helix-turn-helix domain-containing protein [Serratia marcescens]|uniref:helix-turn-helix domain-containing protein n=1 Tax=Serratia marcescens TaxID=615 RepID=UPI00356B73BE